MGGRANANPGRHRCEPTICKFQVQLTLPAARGYEPTVDWCEVSRTCQAPAVVTTAHTPANQATVHCWISPTEDSCVSLPRFASSQQTPCQDSQGATKHIRPRMCRQRRPREHLLMPRSHSTLHIESGTQRTSGATGSLRALLYKLHKHGWHMLCRWWFAAMTQGVRGTIHRIEQEELQDTDVFGCVTVKTEERGYGA